MAINDRHQRDERNRDKNARNAGDLLAREHAQDDRQRMQVNAFADDARVENVILQNSQDDQKDGDVKPGSRRNGKRRDDGRDNADRQRSDERNEFEHARQNAEQNRVIQIKKDKAERAGEADQKTRDKLRAGVSAQSLVDVFENQFGARAPVSRRKDPEKQQPENVDVFEKEKRELGNQDESRRVGNDRQQKCRHISPDFADRSAHSVVDLFLSRFRYPKAFVQFIDAGLPRAQIARHVLGQFLCLLRNDRREIGDADA